MSLLGWALALGATLTAAGPGVAAELQCDGAVSTTRLIVVVDKVGVARGAVVVTVYPDDRRRFLAHHGQVAGVRRPSQAPSTSACVQLPKPGLYAVVVYQDVNGDGRFNRNLLGFPAEPYGLSNDPPNLAGLPTFRSVQFKVGEGDTTIHVPLHTPGR